MARSLLRALVSGTRQMLAAQLFVSVAAVALAGWTLAVTSQAIQERDRLRERVVQLEGELGARGIVAPPAPAVVSAPAPSPALYPAEVGLTPETGVSFPQQILSDLFAPPPPLRTLVLHARSEADAQTARQLAQDVAGEGALDVIVHVTAAGRPSLYAYYDGRQSRSAAAVMARFNDAARRAEIPQWSAQLRGQALPAQGEFTAVRLDIVLPPLPEPPPIAAAPGP
jgi:hypothetical protein